MASGRVGCRALLALGVGDGYGPKFEPEAEKHLREMCTFIGGLERFAVQLEKTVDHIPAFGPVVPYERAVRVSIARPARWHAKSEMDDGTDLGLGYDGESDRRSPGHHRDSRVARERRRVEEADATSHGDGGGVDGICGWS